MDFNSDRRFAPQQNISYKMNIMTDVFGLGVSKAGFHPRMLMYTMLPTTRAAKMATAARSSECWACIFFAMTHSSPIATMTQKLRDIALSIVVKYGHLGRVSFAVLAAALRC